MGLSSADDDGVEEVPQGGSSMLLDAFVESGGGEAHSNKDKDDKDNNNNNHSDNDYDDDDNDAVVKWGLGLSQNFKGINNNHTPSVFAVAWFCWRWERRHGRGGGVHEGMLSHCLGNDWND